MQLPPQCRFQAKEGKELVGEKEEELLAKEGGKAIREFEHPTDALFAQALTPLPAAHGLEHAHSSTCVPFAFPQTTLRCNAVPLNDSQLRRLRLLQVFYR